MRYVLFVFILLFCSVCSANHEDILDSTCLIMINDKCGTGTVFQEDVGGYYWVLSAGHVGTPETKAKLMFFLNGEQSVDIDAEVTWRTYTKDTTDDIAFYRFKKPDGLKIKVMPLAHPDYKVEKNQVFLSCGCPNGGWPSLYRGKITEIYSDSLLFQPKPVMGRSGSGIFDHEGKQIIGLLVMYWGEKGMAVPVDKIHAFIRQAQASR